MSDHGTLENLKHHVAQVAMEYVQEGMIVGLGTGSTANYMIQELGSRVRKGLSIQGIATSTQTAALAKEQGIPLIETHDAWTIDVAIDGADQVDSNLNLIKGGGGALLKEKIVAFAAKQLVIMVDHTKRVNVLGMPFPLPVEVIPFGWGTTARRIERLGFRTMLRRRNETIYITESGNHILDVEVPRIEDPAGLEQALNLLPGVVETGLFVGKTTILLVGTPEGVERQRNSSLP